VKLVRLMERLGKLSEAVGEFEYPRFGRSEGSVLLSEKGIVLIPVGRAREHGVQQTGN
jgi:hypothetical protein